MRAYLLTGRIVANKNIWFIGDQFLTDAIAVLSSMQLQNKDELYIYQAYDVQSFYPNKLCSDSFGKVVRCCLYEALNEHNRLPAVIVVVTGNKDVDDKVSTPFNTKRIWNALGNEIDRAIKARKK